MTLAVQKYGGSSLSTANLIRNTAQRIIATYNNNIDVVVVVSAKSGETNRLISLTRELSETPLARECDIVMATGEQITAGLLAITLDALGYKAKSYLGWQIPVRTDACHAGAAIEHIDVTGIREDIRKGVIVIVAGFQGVDAGGNITTLGRGGADITAVVLADALKADYCEIYTNVDGVYTADPNVCKQARKIEKISYDEMIELASLGSRVMQIRSVEYAKKLDVDLYVRSSFHDTSGTLVTREDKDMENVVVSGVVYDKNEAKIAVMGVPDKPGTAARVLSGLADADIAVDMIVQNVGQTGLADVTFTVSKDELQKAYMISREIAREIKARDVIADENISKVSIVGLGMRNHAGVAARMFSALALNNINIQMISTSEIKIAVAIEEKYTELAVRVLHDAFLSDRSPRPSL